MHRLLLLSLLGCEPAPGPAAGAARDPSGTPAEVVLTRMSLDLRGVRPSLEELSAVRADPTLLDASLDTFLADPRFGERVVALYGEIWSTVEDETEHPAEDLGLWDEPAFARAVGEEPLRILAEVASEDLPWTTILTADWTMVDEQLALGWPVQTIEEPPAGGGWRRARYTDGRPAAGVLSTNGLWWRYETSRNNADRARANALSRILLCRDYLDAEVGFDRSVDLSDEAVVQAALRENPGCATCHASLDPLASFLGGFFVPRKSGLDEFLYYHPEREDIWRTQTGVEPTYFGQPGSTVADLGSFIAADPGFVDCAVEQAAGQLLRAAPSLADIDRNNGYREAFIQGDLRLKALWRAILRSPAYRGLDPENPLQLDRKLVTPDLLASEVEDLTGFRFTMEGIDLLRTSDRGLQALAGGPDGRFATGVGQDFTASLLLVQERLAQAAAHHAVKVQPEHLFGFDPRETPADLEAELSRVHERVLSRVPEPEEVEALAGHWRQVRDLDDPAAAWQSVLTVLLSDPDLLLY